jgi:spore germination protein GerM
VRTSRLFFWIVLLAIVAGIAWYWSSHRRSTIGEHITVYYTKPDGKTEVPWTVSMRPQQPGESAGEHTRNTVDYAAVQAVAGPQSSTPAVRFPPGTHVLSADVNDSTALVDLSGEVKNQTAGVLGESGQFKALVWTLTSLPGIQQVAIRVEGQKLTTLPGGHFEIDEPLRRSDW